MRGLFFCYFKKWPDRNSKEEETGEIVVLTNPLLVFADLACWQSYSKSILSYSSHCLHCAKTSTIEWLELIKPLGKEEYSTTGGWNPLLLQMVWLVNFVWNESRRNISWLEPQAQMAARHEWSCMESQSASPLSTQSCYFADLTFSVGSHVLKENYLHYLNENCILFWMRFYNSASQYVLVYIFYFQQWKIPKP